MLEKLRARYEKYTTCDDPKDLTFRYFLALDMLGWGSAFRSADMTFEDLVLYLEKKVEDDPNKRGRSHDRA